MTTEPKKPQDDEHSGDAAALLQLTYDTLHALATAYLRRERSDHTLQPTALLHEAFIKIQHAGEWQSDAHFKATAANAMRRVLVDHARGRKRQKRGGEWQRVMLTADALRDDRDIDLLALDEALEHLRELDDRKAEVVQLRFFGGMTLKEVGAHLGISPKTVEADWYFARAWLRERLDETQE